MLENKCYVINSRCEMLAECIYQNEREGLHVVRNKNMDEWRCRVWDGWKYDKNYDILTGSSHLRMSLCTLHC